MDTVGDRDILIDGSLSAVIAEAELFFLKNQAIAAKPKHIFYILRVLYRRSKEFPQMTRSDVGFIIKYHIENETKKDDEDLSHFFFSRFPEFERSSGKNDIRTNHND